MSKMVKIKIKKEKVEPNEIKVVEEKVSEDSFMYYPELDDPKFNEKIFVKKEFNKHQIQKLEKTTEEICNAKNFKIAPQQEFLRSYISVNTPYNGILVYHETGVGKTCSAIQISEGFKEIMKRMHTDEKRKIIVILGPRILPNFRKQLYDITKEANKTRPDDIVQCTGNTYSRDFEQFSGLTMQQKVREINKSINNNYKFFGYEQFGNFVMNFLGWDGKMTSLTDAQKKAIKNQFQNRVLVIDEIHNIKSDSSNVELRKVPPILQAVIKFAEKLRIVLMSATPMYDNAREIIYILNLLLENDGRPLIKRNEILDGEDNFVPGGEKRLEEACQGYISYLRGEDPISFPLKIYPNDAEVLDIKYDYKGNEISETDRFKKLKLAVCPMSDYQYTCYNNKLKEDSKNVNRNMENLNNMNKAEDSHSRLQPLFYISNLAMPNKNNENVLAKMNFAYQIGDKDNGEGPFNLIEKAESKTQKKSYQFKFQSHVKHDIGSKNETSFLDEKHLHKYSAKFARALKNIKYGKGICYVYSDFVWGGVLPFALMLEQNGFQRYTVKGETSLLDYKINRVGGGGKRDPICAICGGNRLEKVHENEKLEDYHTFRIAKYIIVTGRASISKIETGQLIDVINNSNNKYGEEVKVVIGTRTVGEGLDFKRIRQIHILEPWYNLSRIQQIVGRGIRFCSHADLPSEERNVEIFLYVSYPPNNASKKEKETEMVDSRFYRLAEIKDRKIKAVEYILKTNAVDCVLNRNGNIYNSDKMFNLITSRGEKIKVSMRDTPGSRECSYMDNCEYECKWMPSKNKKYKINTDTYNSYFARTDIENTKTIIKNLFTNGYIFLLHEILHEVRKSFPTLETQFIYLAINEMLDNINEPIYDQYNRKGYLIYRGNFYVYQPLEFNYLAAPLYYKGHYINEKPLLYIFDQDLEGNENNTYNSQNKKLSGKELQKLIFTEMEKLIKEIPYQDKNKMYIVLGMVIDPLPEKEKVALLKNLVQIYHETKGKMEHIYQIELIKYFDPILIYQYRDVETGKEKDNDVLVGFKMSKYYCYNSSSKMVSECSSELRDKIKLNQKIKNIKEKSKKLVPFNDIYGFMEKWKNGDFIFKIYDGTKASGAKTVDLKVSKRSEIKGKKCLNFSSEELKDLTKKIGIKEDIKQIKSRCRNIEFMLRKYNLENYNGKKWFVNSIENL